LKALSSRDAPSQIIYATLSSLPLDSQAEGPKTHSNVRLIQMTRKNANHREKKPKHVKDFQIQEVHKKKLRGEDFLVYDSALDENGNMQMTGSRPRNNHICYRGKYASSC